MGSAPRHVTRTKSLDVSPSGGDRYHFASRLTDTATGGDFDGDSVVVHDFGVEGDVEGPQLTVVALAVSAFTHPYAACPFVIPASQDLVGHSVMSNWRRSVLDQLGGTQGCTHINTVLLGLGEMTTMIFFLRMNEIVSYDEDTRTDGRWIAEGLSIAPSLAGVCHGLRADGPALRPVLHTSSTTLDQRSR
jgi:hypothetical protein